MQTQPASDDAKQGTFRDKGWKAHVMSSHCHGQIWTKVTNGYSWSENMSEICTKNTLPLKKSICKLHAVRQQRFMRPKERGIRDHFKKMI